MSHETGDAPELSIVMPCLNEAETLGHCISAARTFLDRENVAGEIIVADNGSTDGSQEIALANGARVVHVSAKGYGNALRGGIESSRGEFVVMGDADASYDFSSLSAFLTRLREGYDLVMGNRFLGGIRPGAMPWLHRYLGNPVLTAVGRVFFRSSVGDFHCGLRAFRRDAFDRMDLQSGGMEFASEMVIRSTLSGLRIVEVATILSPDGRSRPPHLRTWRDGWRHLRFMLLFSPRWLFLFPGIAMIAIGTVVMGVLAAGPVQFGTVVFDIHTMFLGGLVSLLGYQLVVFAWFTKMFAVSEGFHRAPAYFSWVFRYLNLEIGLIAGSILSGIGFLLLASAAWGWLTVQLGDLDPRETMRRVVPGAILLAMGGQTVYSSFFLSILGIHRR